MGMTQSDALGTLRMAARYYDAARGYPPKALGALDYVEALLRENEQRCESRLNASREQRLEVQRALATVEDRAAALEEWAQRAGQWIADKHVDPSRSELLQRLASIVEGKGNS